MYIFINNNFNTFKKNKKIPDIDTSGFSVKFEMINCTKFLTTD